MKKLLLPILAIFLTSQVYAWTIKESKQDEDFKVIVNDGGVFTDAITVTGSTSSTALGPVGHTGTQILRGQVEAQHPTVGKYTLNVNNTERFFMSYTESGTKGRIDSDGDIDFAANNTVGGNISAAGAWTFGPSAGSSVTHLLRGNASPTVHIQSQSGSAQLQLERTTTSAGSAWLGASSGGFSVGTSAGGSQLLSIPSDNTAAKINGVAIASAAIATAGTCSSSPCAITSDPLDMLDTVTRSATGTYTLNFTSGYWAAPGPICTLTATLGNSHVCVGNISALSTTTFDILCLATNTTALIDSRFFVTCQGPRA